MSTTEVTTSVYNVAFSRAHASQAATEEPPCDFSFQPGAWSITYGGDCQMDHVLFVPLVIAALNSVTDNGMFLTLTLENAMGHSVSLDCTVPAQVKVQGTGWGSEDAAYVHVYPWFPETESMGVEPIKVYLHQIINIHFP